MPEKKLETGEQKNKSGKTAVVEAFDSFRVCARFPREDGKPGSRRWVTREEFSAWLAE